MTSAVIIFLREILEAMLIVSLLLAASMTLHLRKRWLLTGLLLGLIGAGVYAWRFADIADAFDGVGQEVVNGAMLYLICLMLIIHAVFVFSQRREEGRRLAHPVGLLTMVLAIALAMTREGAELWIYISGYLYTPDLIQPILMGGALGTGIGLSVGALMFFGLMSLSPKLRLTIIAVLCIPVAAGMASQATNYLMQADIISAQLPLWDSSALVPEGSLIGELLYAFFSYEATPTLLQVVAYLVSLGLAPLLMLLERRRTDRSMRSLR